MMARNRCSCGGAPIECERCGRTRDDVGTILEALLKLVVDTAEKSRANRFGPVIEHANNALMCLYDQRAWE